MSSNGTHASPVTLESLNLSAGGQPVDMEAAKEFMRLTLENVERAELDAVEAELQEKGRRLRRMLAPQALAGLSAARLHAVLRTVFATRRRARHILAAAGADQMRTAIAQLLYDGQPVDLRFQGFVDTMTGFVGDVRLLRPKKSSDSRARQSAEQAALQENVFCDLGSELLHFTNPAQYWLWTRWVWDPRNGTGAMPLLTMEEVDLHGRAVGETYMKLGAATAFVRETGNAAGISNIGSGSFGIDVFLACVYAVYMYTTLRLRMTQEFNKVVPQLPELIRRLLGVWRMPI